MKISLSVASAVRPRPRAGGRLAAFCIAALCLLLQPAVSQPTTSQQDSTPASTAGTGTSSTFRLRQNGAQDNVSTRRDDAKAQLERDAPALDPLDEEEAPTDFELYVRRLAAAGGDRRAQTDVRDVVPGLGNARGPQSSSIRRFGSASIGGMRRELDTTDYNPLIPADYLLRAGDEVMVTLWGSVDADLRLVIDRSGRVTIPRIGPVMLSGVRYADAPDAIGRRVAQVFKNFQISVSLGQLRGQRVYVTGFVRKPGALQVSSLATLAQALLRAGGPSAAGSFRDIQLRRGRDVVARFDLYDLLLKGDRSNDVLLQADDVVHVGPVGVQVALIGSVNQPAIFEIKPGETVQDLLRMAGGFTAVADATRLTLERLDTSSASRLVEVRLPESASMALGRGDVVRAFNASDLERPMAQQSKRIRIEGEVARPGEYVLPAGTSLADALRAAGGITEQGYLYGVEFNRESVRATQQMNYERALRDLETQITTASATRRASNSDEAAAQASSRNANERLLQQLRRLQPSGRIVLLVPPDATALPDLALENGDRLFVPARPTTVGVFGSVFSTGSYLYSPNRKVDDYLRLAGGPTRGADQGSVFVIRANGAVTSSLQEGGYFARGNQLAGLTTEPGDTIFVPEEMDKTTWVQNAKDWTQIFYQFGIGLAGIRGAIN